MVCIAETSLKKIELEWERVCSILQECELEGKLQFKRDTTEAMIISATNKIIEPSIKIGNTAVKMKGSIKYLGVEIGRGLLFINPIRQIKQKVLQFLNMLWKVSRRDWGVS